MVKIGNVFATLKVVALVGVKTHDPRTLKLYRFIKKTETGGIAFGRQVVIPNRVTSIFPKSWFFKQRYSLNRQKFVVE